MDLREARGPNQNRHPWELARVAALRQLLCQLPCCRFARVLDLGAGDGFTANQLLMSFPIEHLVCFDAAFTPEHIETLQGVYPHIKFTPSLATDDEPYGLVLMLDVLEHVDQDRTFFAAVIRQRLLSGGFILLTVPAFDALFGPHDIQLKHFRRYHRSQLISLAQGAGLTQISTGYLFGSLFLLRSLAIGWGMLRWSNPKTRSTGVGQWTHGVVLTRLIEGVLRLENRLMLAGHRLGFDAPGLTLWLIAQKP